MSYDYGARWYDPKLGRFLSADSIIPDPNNPSDYDRYAYVRNNPINFTDPSGHCSVAAMERGECTAKELYSKHPKRRAVDEAKGFVGDYEWRNPFYLDDETGEVVNNDFYEYFVLDSGELEEISTMNCWETVLLSAYKAGEVDSKWIVTTQQSKKTLAWIIQKPVRIKAWNR